MNIQADIAETEEALGVKRRIEIWRRVLGNVTPQDCGFETECWLWNGATSGEGRGGKYPRMKIEGQTVAVHRVVWITLAGYLPRKKQIDHKCRQRRCVRPSHLEKVTQLQNCRRRDAALKERLDAQA